MQSSIKEWIIRTVAELPEQEARQLKDYLEFLTWKSRRKPKPENGENLIAQRLIEAMESPPHLSHKDVEALRQSIEQGKIPVNRTSPFMPNTREKS